MPKTEPTRSAGAPRPRGRPRSERRRLAILHAARDLLDHEGFAAVSVEAVADRAGVSKATIYRWWPNRAAVVMDAFLEDIGKPEAPPDTGSTQEDLRRQLASFHDLLRGRHGRAVASLIAAAQHDVAVRAALRERFVQPRIAYARATLQRGVERGELREDLDLHVAYDALYAPLYHRLLTGHRPLGRRFVGSVIDHALTGMAAQDRRE